MGVTAKDLESLLEQRISQSLESLRSQFDWTGYRLHVALLDKKSPQERQCDALAENWSPSMLEIRISFELEQAAPAHGADMLTPVFRPIPIRGEPMSQTVLRERR